MSIECPNCRLASPDGTETCDCGYDFKAESLRVKSGAVHVPGGLSGVRGWLKLFVVGNLYIGPILFGLQYGLACIGFILLAEKYPAIVVVGLFETALRGFLVWKWIQIAKGLRDIRPGVIQETRTWLKRSVALIVLSSPVGLLIGMNARDVVPGMAKAIVLSLLGFSIWYSYFKVSKRVRATYTDWNA